MPGHFRVLTPQLMNLDARRDLWYRSNWDPAGFPRTVHFLEVLGRLAVRRGHHADDLEIEIALASKAQAEHLPDRRPVPPDRARELFVDDHHGLGVHVVAPVARSGRKLRRSAPRPGRPTTGAGRAAAPVRSWSHRPFRDGPEHGAPHRTSTSRQPTAETSREPRATTLARRAVAAATARRLLSSGGVPRARFERALATAAAKQLRPIDALRGE